MFGLSMHPFYERLLARLRAHPDSRLLDIGTCLGQDLRKLAYDGAPISSLYGTDVFAAYEDAGFRLFNDADRFANHFLVMDFLSDEQADNLVAHGGWDVQSATMFLHLFDLPSQEKACRKMLQSSAGKGSWILGASSASVTAGEQMMKPPFVKEGENKSVYRQSKESFAEMWEKIAAEVGKKVSIWAEYEDREEAVDKSKKTFWSGDTQKRMLFFVEVLE